jgi:hypothetical protein
MDAMFDRASTDAKKFHWRADPLDLGAIRF